VPTVLRSGSFNLLEPSGPIQACNGIALPLPLHLPQNVLVRAPGGTGIKQWLNRRTSSSDISGYHADFVEEHGTVGEWQGRVMAWERHGRGMACVN
jgi:hypothetical protein